MATLDLGSDQAAVLVRGRGLRLGDERTCSRGGVTSPRLQRGCSFLPQPEFAGFIWSAPGFTFQYADEAERDLHSHALE